jgi:hypothetical protein
VNVHQPIHEGFVDGDPVQPLPATPAGTKRASPPPTIEPSPAELPPLPVNQWPIIIALMHKPIRNNTGEEVRQVSMREPRAGDINR